MKIYFLCISLLVISLPLFNSCNILRPAKQNTITEIANQFNTDFNAKKISYSKLVKTNIDTMIIDSVNSTLTIHFDKQFASIPFRPNLVDSIYLETYKYFDSFFSDDKIYLRTTGFDIRDLIPNYFRTNNKIDSSRFPPNNIRPNPIVFNKSKNIRSNNGLYNKNIALWHSHGWYYNHKLDRWMWQRARLFQTVEDLGPLTFTVPFIIPMLENAGANVFLPRERDFQLNEVIVDNEDLNNCIFDTQSEWRVDKTSGYKQFKESIPANYNPFNGGTSNYAQVTNKISKATYTPEIPEDGKYSVYISYGSFSKSSDSVLYTVSHTGGKTDFIVNQTIGNNTWIHLGKFNFSKGRNKNIGSVQISSKYSMPGEIISTDAIRFGGGYGVVERNGNTSNRPKFVEGARYFLQFLGMPDTVIYNINENTNDYKDDYQSRGEWLNYLKGKPSGPNKNRAIQGLRIPIDASIAFHTDAGKSGGDTTIGTLAIYSSIGIDSSNIFPEGYSRLANRDFTDILQSEIVNDIRSKYDPIWKHRGLRDAMYSEAARPNIPSTLLELASHQNFLDSKFMADPRFKFDVSRSIYKAVLKFLSVQYNYEYVVQPLPVNHFRIEQTSKNSIKLSWQPQIDPIEKTAIPNSYMLYKSINENGFDNGTLIQNNSIEIEALEFNTIYNFRITAINNGGESFPSETLSCSFKNNDLPTVLIVNGFDRIAPPAVLESNEYSGFFNKIDQGVPYYYDLGFTGEQHNFYSSSKWTSDDVPGHGASYADYETKVINGNTFNYAYVHGKAISDNDYSFISVSDEVFSQKNFEVGNYKIIDLIMGEEKTTNWTKPFTDSLLGTQYSVFNDSLVNNLKTFLNAEGKLFVSGSYIASDVFLNNGNKLKHGDFLTNYLKYNLDSDHAVVGGEVFSTFAQNKEKNFNFSFATELNDSIYNAEAPDALKPVNGSNTILRYSENHFSAGVAYKDKYSIIALGFPFETIKTVSDRKRMMHLILNYFE